MESMSRPLEHRPIFVRMIPSPPQGMAVHKEGLLWGGDSGLGLSHFKVNVEVVQLFIISILSIFFLFKYDGEPLWWVGIAMVGVFILANLL